MDNQKESADHQRILLQNMSYIYCYCLYFIYFHAIPWDLQIVTCGRIVGRLPFVSHLNPLCLSIYAVCMQSTILMTLITAAIIKLLMQFRKSRLISSVL